MIRGEAMCSCGRDAVEVIHVASEDGVLLIPVCADCGDDPAAGEQRELFGHDPRRPLATMPPRDGRTQPSLPFEDFRDVDGAEHGAA